MSRSRTRPHERRDAPTVRKTYGATAALAKSNGTDLLDNGWSFIETGRNPHAIGKDDRYYAKFKQSANS